MADPIGVSIAYSDGLLTVSPTWTQLDSLDNLVAQYTIRRGRTSEFDRTDAGTATISFNDTTGLFDPTKAFFGEFTGKEAAIALHNPVTDTWPTIYRGVIDNNDAEMDPSQVVTRADISMVDWLALLAEGEVAPGIAGAPPPVSSEGDVFYDATAGTANLRILEVLGDYAAAMGLGDWPVGPYPSGLSDVFSANVQLQPTIYSTGSSYLSVIDDAADAEFPAVANRFVTKLGEFAFRGRLARFNPTDPTYKITTWKLGDGQAILADPTVCQIRELGWRRSRADVINAAYCTPKPGPNGIYLKDTERPAQLILNSTSIGTYGVHSWSAEDLVIQYSELTTNDPKTECQLYGTYMTTVYGDPQTRVTTLTVRSLDPTDPRASAVWAFMCGVELSDRIQLITTHPGGGGFDNYFFVEGLTYTVLPLQPGYQNVTLTIDVSPAEYYDFAWT